MAKGGSEFAVQVLECQEVASEHRRTGLGREPDPGTEDPGKLHRWSGEDAARRFDDLFVRHEAPE